MPAKNKKKNAFYFYMKQRQEQEARKGRKISMNNMAAFAHSDWQKMPSEEKQRYEDLAKEHKNDPCLRGPKFASDGTKIEDNLREAEEEIRKENRMKQDIKRYCNVDCVSEEQFKEYSSRKLFYFISFNILCKTEEEIYIPVEVGLVEYSIQHGIHRCYHKILHPGAIPTGYKGEAKRISEDKHQIDIFGHNSDKVDVRIVYSDIMSFTNQQEVDEYPPLFCMDDQLELTRGCLEWLAHCSREENVFEVWNATYLLMELRAGVGNAFVSISIASDLLHKTSFNYHPKTRCKFHEEKDVHYCALGYSKCLCYFFSDALCPLFNVTLTENHIPSVTTENKEYTVTLGRGSFSSRQYLPAKTVDNGPMDLKQNDYLQNTSKENPVENTYVPGTSADAVPKKPTISHRQPSGSCMAAEMTRLRLNMTSATVPGHGIGRGQRRLE